MPPGWTPDATALERLERLRKFLAEKSEFGEPDPNTTELLKRVIFEQSNELLDLTLEEINRSQAAALCKLIQTLNTIVNHPVT